MDDHIVGYNEFIILTVATHNEFMETVVSNKSCLTFSILLEKSKDEDIRTKEAITKWDYMCAIRYCPR
ncbi:hypothetical protein BD408DRAFT_345066 [Parasitella parasitica]|nr:hypothetical protein BD408DRAFT_345066 [Parasitella parasitica]